MATWQVLVGEETFNLSDRAPFDVVSATGVGLSPVRLITQRGPLQHGETALDFRLDARSVNLVMAFAASSLAAADEARDRLAYIFGPRRIGYPVRLQVTRDDGTVRRLDCRTSGIADFPITESDRFGRMQRCAIQLIAVEPNWYDPAPEQLALSLASISAGMQVPVVMPLLFSSGSSGGDTVQIPYSGTFDEYPVITVTGPVADLLIENVTSGDELSFLGYTLPAGRTMTIDLRYGHKSIIDSTDANRIGDLTEGSDLATWRLLSILETGDGYNNVRLSGASLTAASAVSIQYYHRYLSL